jgi:predicted nucleic acid-binding protein
MATALYLDTSCLLKLLFAEPESGRVAELVAAEPQVLVSTLARLEALVQIGARLSGGTMNKRAAHGLVKRLEEVLGLAPFEVVATPPELIEIAAEQILPIGKTAHCRTLDRLHLAAMQALSLERLLTNDDVQAAAAMELGFEVSRPR